MMITIHPMPTQLRPLPELELELDIPQLRDLAYVLDRVRTDSQLRNGLCIAVAGMATPSVGHAFCHAVLHGMSKYSGNQYCVYLYQYLGEYVTIEELTAIRKAWAAHIARSIYEQIGE